MPRQSVLIFKIDRIIVYVKTDYKTANRSQVRCLKIKQVIYHGLGIAKFRWKITFLKADRLQTKMEKMTENEYQLKKHENKNENTTEKVA